MDSDTAADGTYREKTCYSNSALPHHIITAGDPVLILHLFSAGKTSHPLR